MINNAIILCCLITWSVLSQAQATFNKTIDYNQGWEFARSVIASDTGYFIFGSAGNQIHPIKLNLNFTSIEGNHLISKVFRVDSMGLYNGISGTFKQKSDGQFYSIGSIQDLQTSLYDFALYLFDEKCDSIAFHYYGKPDKDEIGNNITEMPDGGYLLIGTTGIFAYNTMDIKAIRTDSMGNVLWDTTYGGFLNDVANNVAYIGNNKIAIGGTNYNWDKGWSWLFVIDANTKQIIWQVFYPGSLYSGRADFNLTNDGGFILYSRRDTIINGKLTKLNYLRKLDSLGNLDWHRDLYHHDNSMQIWIARQTMDGSYIFCGDRDNKDGKQRGYIAKLDTNGLDILWEREYYYNSWSSHYLADIQQTADGGYIAVGMTHDQTQDNWVLKVDSMGCLVPGCHLTNVEEYDTEVDFKIYPNPNSGSFSINFESIENISVTIFDMAGRQVYQKRSAKKENPITIPNAMPGIYLVKILSGEKVMIKKIVVE